MLIKSLPYSEICVRIPGFVVIFLSTSGDFKCKHPIQAISGIIYAYLNSGKIQIDHNSKIGNNLKYNFIST